MAPPLEAHGDTTPTHGEKQRTGGPRTRRGIAGEKNVVYVGHMRSREPSSCVARSGMQVMFGKKDHSENRDETGKGD